MSEEDADIEEERGRSHRSIIILITTVIIILLLGVVIVKVWRNEDARSGSGISTPPITQEEANTISHLSSEASLKLREFSRRSASCGSYDCTELAADPALSSLRTLSSGLRAIDAPGVCGIVIDRTQGYVERAREEFDEMLQAIRGGDPSVINQRLDALQGTLDALNQTSSRIPKVCV